MSRRCGVAVMRLLRLGRRVLVFLAGLLADGGRERFIPRYVMSLTFFARSSRRWQSSCACAGALHGISFPGARVERRSVVTLQVTVAIVASRSLLLARAKQTRSRSYSISPRRAYRLRAFVQLLPASSTGSLMTPLAPKSNINGRSLSSDKQKKTPLLR